jgi:hypothetical protein
MKKISSLLFVIVVYATATFAADPGQVVKVDAQSITVHWQTPEAYIPGRSDLDSSQQHGMAVGGYGGSSHQFTFKLTPQTTYWQGAKQVTVASIQKGARVKVTATHEVASRVDIL